MQFEFFKIPRLWRSRPNHSDVWYCLEERLSPVINGELLGIWQYMVTKYNWKLFLNYNLPYPYGHMVINSPVEDATVHCVYVLVHSQLCSMDNDNGDVIYQLATTVSIAYYSFNSTTYIVIQIFWTDCLWEVPHLTHHRFRLSYITYCTRVHTIWDDSNRRIRLAVTFSHGIIPFFWLLPNHAMSWNQRPVDSAKDGFRSNQNPQWFRRQSSLERVP